MHIKNSKQLNSALGLGALYFACMATAHYLGLKLPVLFIYYDTPFYSYQDKIISFAVCAYIGLFYLGTRNRENARVAIIALGLTVLGLSSVNLSADLQQVLVDGQGTQFYWLQTLSILGYLGLLLFLFLSDPKRNQHSNT